MQRHNEKVNGETLMYVKLNTTGSIEAISDHPKDTYVPYRSDMKEALDHYLQHKQADVNGADKKSQTHNKIRTSDMHMIRVIDDLANALMTKGILTFNDLPREAVQKLLDRQSLRKDLSDLDLIGDEDESFMP